MTPFIFVTLPDRLMDFLEAAFDAEVTHRGSARGGGYHGEARVGQTMIMVGGGEQAVGRELRASRIAALFRMTSMRRIGGPSPRARRC